MTPDGPDRPMDGDLLTVEGLSAGYGPVRVLWDVDLRIGRGEVVALVGANGAGKTTLLRTISGFLRPTSGRVRLAESDISGVPPHEIAAAGIAHVLEGRRLFAGLSVEANLRLGAYVRRRNGSTTAALDRVFGLFPELATRRRQIAGTLSGGEQQMAAIGRGLMSDPDVLLIDEMSLGLAPLLVDRISATVATLKGGKSSILLVDQDVQVALSLADRGYVLETGRVVLSGPSAGLLNNDLIKAAYLGL